MTYEEFGKPSDPAMVLIMGLGMQMHAWPDEFCSALAEKGFRVIRLDNRDAGLSQKFADSQAPHPVKLMLRSRLGLKMKVPYLLQDMAEDTVSLLDYLQIESAHIVGASMGGMIAQLVAASYPERSMSLTSIMSSSGAPSLPQASIKVLKQLTRKPGVGEEAYLANAKRTWRMISSPAYTLDDAALSERLLSAYRRSHYPQGLSRQMAAIIASGDRSAKLRTVRVPTLVIHGQDDVLVPVQAGIDTAKKIPNARLELIPGMGHDLPRDLFPHFVNKIAALASAATTSATSQAAH
ncbi:alpha/beta hydrolase [Zhongshania borealis]|uniref:Alpha/beta hydrolase n=2 Tax=Zhongshania borealis TaxID=889488 RepID=A0ABP7WRP4_9GAMM